MQPQQARALPSLPPLTAPPAAPGAFPPPPSYRPRGPRKAARDPLPQRYRPRQRPSGSGRRRRRRKGKARSRLSRASRRAGPRRLRRAGRSGQQPCPGALPSSQPHRFRVTGAERGRPPARRRCRTQPGPARSAATRGRPLGPAPGRRAGARGGAGREPVTPKREATARTRSAAWPFKADPPPPSPPPSRAAGALAPPPPRRPLLRMRGGPGAAAEGWAGAAGAISRRPWRGGGLSGVGALLRAAPSGLPPPSGCSGAVPQPPRSGHPEGRAFCCSSLRAWHGRQG